VRVSAGEGGKAELSAAVGEGEQETPGGVEQGEEERRR
jgi:hypothetical protein